MQIVTFHIGVSRYEALWGKSDILLTVGSILLNVKILENPSKVSQAAPLASTPQKRALLVCRI